MQSLKCIEKEPLKEKGITAPLMAMVKRSQKELNTGELTVKVT